MATLRRDHKFAKALAASLKRTKMSRSDVARSLNVARSTVRSWLPPHNSEPSEPNFRKLCVLFPELEKFA